MPPTALTRPHLKNLVLDVLDDLKLDFHNPNSNNQQCLYVLTADQLYKMSEQEQIKMAIVLNKDISDFDSCDLAMFSGHKLLAEDDSQMHRMLKAVNWARKFGGTVTQSVCSYTQWLQIWNLRFQYLGDMCRNLVTATTEMASFRNWINQRSKIRPDFLSAHKYRIGGNSGTRCWFFAVLYSLLGIEQFWTSLYTQKTKSDGHMLLYSVALSLKLAIMQQNTGALDVITQFCEAFLQGHFCHWSDYGSIDSAFRILQRMTTQDQFFAQFEVKCSSWRECVVHNDYGNHYQAGWHISFYMPITWDNGTGHITAQMSSNNRCSHVDQQDNSLCPLRTTQKIFHICNDQKDYFVLSCEEGIPQNMWLALLRNHVIRIGEHLRKIDIGIFLINSNHFVSAYLIDNPSTALHADKKKWIKFETVDSEIKRLESGINRTNLKYLFVTEPNKSCLICRNVDNLSMINCRYCKSLYHQNCVELELDSNDNMVYNGDECKSQECQSMFQELF